MDYLLSDPVNSSVKRAQLYLFLSFALISEPKLNNVINFIPVELEHLLKMFLPDEPAVYEFIQFMDDWNVNTKLRLNVRKDYDTLFISPKGYRISLCEADYQVRDEDYKGEIKKIRESASLSNPSYIMRFDHLGLILRTMNDVIMIGHKADTLNQGTQKQAMVRLEGIVLAKHLVPWLSIWVQAVSCKGQTQYYDLLSTLTSRFVHMDYNYVRSLLGLPANHY